MNTAERNRTGLVTGILLGTGLLLGGCAFEDVDRLAEAPKSGHEYNDLLARNYAEFAKFEADKMYDHFDAAHFAGKGLKALHGEPVEPERPADWSIESVDVNNRLQAARIRLTDVLAEGAADKAPAATARAMVSYDCWVEQWEEGWQMDHIAGCRDGFEKAMAIIDARMRPVAGAEKPRSPVAAETDTAMVVAQQPREPEPPQDFLVFFDWDEAEVTASARTVLQSAMERAKASGITSFELVGHADRSGSPTYNRELSVQRANAIADVLVDEGFARKDIRIIGRGEEDPLVETDDGVREPQNRRVRISFSDQMASN